MNQSHDLQPLVDAIVAGDDAGLRRLLAERPPDVLNERLARSVTTLGAGHDFTLLQFAAFRRWHEAAPTEVLIDRGATVDLHSACGIGDLEQVRRCLAAGHNLNKSVGGCVPLQFAIAAGRSAVVKHLLQHGEQPNRRLQKVAYFAREDDVAGKTEPAWRPAHMAVLWAFYDSSIEVLQTLREAGGDFTAASPLQGFQPLHLAALSGKTDVAHWLLSFVDVNSLTASEPRQSESVDGPVTGERCTPLMIAAAEGFPETVSRLLQAGASTTVRNSHGWTALDFARAAHWNGRPYAQIIRLLRDSVDH